MTPYLFAPVQMRNIPLVGEWRDVGVLLVERGGGTHVELARAPLRKVVLWPGEDVDVAREVMDDIETAAARMVRPDPSSPYSTLVEWWRARAAHREDFVRLMPPRPGVTGDIAGEARRVLAQMTGLGAERRRRSEVQRTIRTVLAEGGLRAAFREGTLHAGGLELRFARLWKRPGSPVVIRAFDARGETRADRLVFRAGKWTTESRLLQRHGVRLDTIVVAAAPGEQALGGVYADARSLLEDAGMTVLPPEPEALRRALIERGAPIAA